MWLLPPISGKLIYQGIIGRLGPRNLIVSSIGLNSSCIRISTVGPECETQIPHNPDVRVMLSTVVVLWSGWRGLLPRVPLGVRKFRLTTTSRVRARRPTLGVRAAPAMPIKLAKTRKQTKLKLSDLTSLNLTFFSQHTKRQAKCPWLCSSHCAVSLALLFCCWHAPCWSIKFQRWSHPNFSENRPCNCCWKINITFSTNMLSSRSHAAKM